jgi:hypothetical protein
MRPHQDIATYFILKCQVHVDISNARRSTIRQLGQLRLVVAMPQYIVVYVVINCLTVLVMPTKLSDDTPQQRQHASIDEPFKSVSSVSRFLRISQL